MFNVVNTDVPNCFESIEMLDELRKWFIIYALLIQLQDIYDNDQSIFFY